MDNPTQANLIWCIWSTNGENRNRVLTHPTGGHHHHHHIRLLKVGWALPCIQLYSDDVTPLFAPFITGYF